MSVNGCTRIAWNGKFKFSLWRKFICKTTEPHRQRPNRYIDWFPMCERFVCFHFSPSTKWMHAIAIFFFFCSLDENNELLPSVSLCWFRVNNNDTIGYSDRRRRRYRCGNAFAIDSVNGCCVTYRWQRLFYQTSVLSSFVYTFRMDRRLKRDASLRTCVRAFEAIFSLFVSIIAFLLSFTIRFSLTNVCLFGFFFCTFSSSDAYAMNFPNWQKINVQRVFVRMRYRQIESWMTTAVACT